MISNLDVKMRSQFRDWLSPFKFENGISEDRLPFVRDFFRNDKLWAWERPLEWISDIAVTTPMAS